MFSMSTSLLVRISEGAERPESTIYKYIQITCGRVRVYVRDHVRTRE